MDSLRWDDLRTFLAVARSGSLTGAAEPLGVNPSTVHRRIASLEDALGGTLFDRDPRGYALTALGEALVPAAEEMEESALALVRKARGHDRSASGPVWLTLPETLLTPIAPALARVRQTCPGLRPIVRAEDEVLSLGANVDLALRPSSQPPEHAIGRKVGAIAWAVYGPAGPPCDPPWITFAEGRGPQRATAWRRRAHPGVDVLLEVTTVGAMHRVLACNRAQGLLPCYLGDPDGRLARHSPVITEATTDLWLLIHADLRRSARVRALVDLLAPALEELRPVFAGEPG